MALDETHPLLASGVLVIALVAVGAVPARKGHAGHGRAVVVVMVESVGMGAAGVGAGL